MWGPLTLVCRIKDWVKAINFGSPNQRLFDSYQFCFAESDWNRVFWPWTDFGLPNQRRCAGQELWFGSSHVLSWTVVCFSRSQRLVLSVDTSCFIVTLFPTTRCKRASCEVHKLLCKHLIPIVLVVAVLFQSLSQSVSLFIPMCQVQYLCLFPCVKYSISVYLTICLFSLDITLCCWLGSKHHMTVCSCVYLFVRVFVCLFSPDITLCVWLGSKH